MDTSFQATGLWPFCSGQLPVSSTVPDMAQPCCEHELSWRERNCCSGAISRNLRIPAGREDLYYCHSYTPDLENSLPAPLGRIPDIALLFSQKLRLKTEEENRIHAEIEIFLRKEQQVGPQNFLILWHVCVLLIKYQGQQKKFKEQKINHDSTSLINELYSPLFFKSYPSG